MRVKERRLRRGGKLFPLGIFLVALAVRLLPVLLTRQLSIGLDDMFQYDMLARSLASGNGFRWYAPADLRRIAPYLNLDPAEMSLDPRGMLTTFRAPLYPAFLSLIYSLNGINEDRFFAARLAQALLGAALAPLTYFAAISLLRIKSAPGREADSQAAGSKAPGLAAWVVALYPMLVIFPLALATENLFFLLVLLSILMLFQLAAASTPRRVALYAVLSGLVLGLSALTRSVIIPFAGLAILWVWVSLKQRRAAVLAGLALIATIAPWIIRNSLLSHKLTGIETSMGYNLYVGYYPGSTGTFVFGPSLDLMSIMDDAQRDQAGTQRALQFIQRDPGRFPYLAVRRLGYFFNLELRAFSYFYVNDFLGHIPMPALVLILVVLAAPFVAIALSAALGWCLLPKRPESLLLVLLFAGYILPHVLILSEERFHLTLVPFIAIAAAVFWTNPLRAFRSRGSLLLSASALVVVLLLANWGLELSRDLPTLLRMLGPTGNQLYLPY